MRRFSESSINTHGCVFTMVELEHPSKLDSQGKWVVDKGSFVKDQHNSKNQLVKKFVNGHCPRQLSGAEGEG